MRRLRGEIDCLSSRVVTGRRRPKADIPQRPLGGRSVRIAYMPSINLGRTHWYSLAGPIETLRSAIQTLPNDYQRCGPYLVELMLRFDCVTDERRSRLCELRQEFAATRPKTVEPNLRALFDAHKLDRPAIEWGSTQMRRSWLHARCSSGPASKPLQRPR